MLPRNIIQTQYDGAKKRVDSSKGDIEDKSLFLALTKQTYR